MISGENDNKNKTELYNGITFAVATSVMNGHYLQGSMWATRDNGAGDSLGGERCGDGSLRVHGVPNPNHPTFKRMVKFLQSQNIPVTVWSGSYDGGEGILPLDTFLARRKRLNSLKAMGV
jgi:hypothetical protein